MPSIYSHHYTLSSDAYNHLLNFNIHRATTKTQYQAWDGTSTVQFTPTFQYTPQTLKPHQFDNPTRGLSRSLDELTRTIAIENWIDNRPKYVRAAHRYSITTPATIPPELMPNTTTQAYKQYIKDNPIPTYQIPYYQQKQEAQDNDNPRKRYKLSIQPFARDYYFRLAHRFNMSPLYKGGRSSLTSYVSAALEAIGMEYIIPNQDGQDKQDQDQDMDTN